MNISNLTPTKLLIGCLLLIILGIVLFYGLFHTSDSASQESTAVKATVPTPSPHANTQKPAPTTMTGFETSPEKKGEEKFIKFDSPLFQKGRQLWLENCENCHAWGTAGAPIPMEANDWKDRVIKEKLVLYDHAINGFFGPGDTMMPARGGNDALSDEQVKSAVDYMVALASYYINAQETSNN